jgi:HEAT repeat protein
MTIRTTYLGLCLVLGLWPAGAGAEEDRLGAMAEQLLQGRRVLDYEAALSTFVKQNDPRVLPTLLKLLERGEPAGRAEAAGVLWMYDTKEVRERLVEMAKDPEAAVRIEAAKSLCLMKYAASLEIITAELKNSDAGLRARSLRALGAIGGEPAIQALQAFKPSSAADRIWGAYALAQAGVQRPAQLALLEKELVAVPRPALLIGQADPGEAELRKAALAGAPGLEARVLAAEALSRLGDEAALALLVEGLADRAADRHPSGAHRLLLRHRDEAALACAKALGTAPPLVRLGCAQLARDLSLRTDQAREALGQALGESLEDASGQVRRAALKAIAAQGLRSQAPRVARALEHADAASRREAARALGRLGDERYAETLLGRLKDEKDVAARRAVYQGLTSLASPRTTEALFKQLKVLYKKSRSSVRAAEELTLCVRALGATGAPAAEKVLKLLPKLSGERRELMLEVLAKSGAEPALDYFLDVLREGPPEPDSPAVRFFDSLGEEHLPRLAQLVESETAMWIRVILARALVRQGRTDFGRGILWGLKNEDAYMRRLAAALCADLGVPGSVEPLVALLADEPRTARYAARALLSLDSTPAWTGLARNLGSDSLRRRAALPLLPYWEGKVSVKNPFAKEVENDRVWVLFAEDRLGRPYDLFLTWSVDGRTWNDPVFTGLTSFIDREDKVPPPTFSLQVRGRALTIALTRTFAQGGSEAKPQLKTQQRVNKFKLEDLHRDKDQDDLVDQEEAALFTSPTKADSDGDGMLDGRDRNPLAKPADPTRDEDAIAVLAFSYAHLIRGYLGDRTRLLVVEDVAGRRRAPELPTFGGLVLHLRPEQIRELWSQTGVAYPRVRFDAVEFETGRRVARQAIAFMEGPGEESLVEVSLVKREDTWVVTGCRLAD